MPQQVDDQQFYAIKACLERAYKEIESAWGILYGNNKAGKPPTQGAAPTTPNPGGKQFTPTPPVVRKDHQSALDEKNPEIQAQQAAEEQTSQANLKDSISKEVSVLSAAISGDGDYYMMVQCETTMQQASIKIDQYEYDEIQSILDDGDNINMTLSQSQIDAAEWEPLRGTSTDPAGQCNCGGNVPNGNAYNDPKIQAEIVSKHTRNCAFWLYNTITYDQQTGRPCQVDLDQVDKSAVEGFNLYNNARKVILQRAADPADPIVLVENDENEEEFGIKLALEQLESI